jgi:ADP-ribosyl-[dinitrogen reductase] hydrolase
MSENQSYVQFDPQCHSELKDRAVAAYLGLAVGDALGATLEFMTPREIQHEYGVHKEIIGGGWLRLKPGQVTDDTTMSLALGNSLIEERGINPHAIANAFSGWLRSKPVDIGHTVRRGIVHFRYGGIPIVPESETDAGNGACMRTLPIALSSLFLNEVQVRTYSRDQAHTTHNNALSDAATECIIFMIQSAMSSIDKAELRTKWVLPIVEKYPLFEFENKRQENPSGYIVETFQAVIQAFFENSNFKDSMIDVVNRGGDSDTTGAILGMLAGAYYGLEAIPAEWIDCLDPAIKQTCEQQAVELLELAVELSKQVTNHSNRAANG